MSAHGRKSTNPMDKRVPENPKYKHVKHTVDTGASMSKYLEKVEELKRDYNFRKDEVFKRMKISTFVQLVLQVAEFDNIPTDDDLAYGDTSRSGRPDTADDEVARIQHGNAQESSEDTTTSGTSPDTDTSRSRLQQVINGTGEIDLDAPKARPPPASIDCPYLMLDVRDQDEFNECHIVTAKSYPTAMLARSVNYETQDMLKFKNQPGKIILVYDNDERISHRAATTLVQRGYDNLFMLSGGLRVAYKIFPDGLVTGTIPTSIWEEAHPPSKNPKNREQQQKVPANIKYFTPECVDNLTMLLDGALTDRSVGSRLSKASRMGRSTSLTTTSSMSSMGKKPFK